MDSVDKTELIFALHAHQPIGNFDHVFREITEESYRPFLETFSEFDCGPVGYHASGILYEWWKENYPEMIDLIGDLVEADRLELLAGGYYEPILSLLPRDDRKRQLEKHCDFLENTFSTRPRGAWLTERIWSPELPGDLRAAGLEYTTVDDFHFQAAGWNRSQLEGFYQTEFSGKTLGIFPISKNLRYKIPFSPVDEIINHLDGADGSALTMADDAEKFGSWPETDEWVYGDGWLERFLAACDSDDIRLTSPEKYYGSNPASGTCYLPTTSYQEMQEWVLPPDRKLEYEKVKHKLDEGEQQFLRGGHFQHFLVKYPESNRMHKKMIWLNSQLGENDDTARDHLLRAQCNDSYWHGIFGGLALPHLRAGIWKHLALALGESEIQPTGPSLTDYNRDGQQEVLYYDETQFLVSDPAAGGQLVVWELFPAARNVLDTLTRRWEAYLEEETTSEPGEADDGVDTIHHKKIEVKSEWLKNWSEDECPRAGFQPVTLQSDRPPDGKPPALDYPLQDCAPENVDCGDAEIFYTYDNTNTPFKSVGLQPERNELTWTATCDFNGGWWGVQFPMAFRSPDAEDCHLKVNGEIIPPGARTRLESRNLELIDRPEKINLSVSCGDELTMLVEPIESITRSEKEAEKIYQGTSITFLTTTDEVNLNFRW